MMFTLLGAPGVVTAANSDLATSEYNFAVNELSRTSLNQAAIIGQQGVLNDAQVRGDGSKLLSIVSGMGQVTGRGLINQGLIILRILLRAALRMMQILRRMDW